MQKIPVIQQPKGKANNQILREVYRFESPPTPRSCREGRIQPLLEDLLNSNQQGEKKKNPRPTSFPQFHCNAETVRTQMSAGHFCQDSRARNEKRGQDFSNPPNWGDVRKDSTHTPIFLGKGKKEGRETVNPRQQELSQYC